MSGYAFDFLSGTVTVRAEAPEAWEREGLAAFYQDPNEPRWSGMLSQVLLHESAHFWQFFASGYLANLVADEWQRLNTFEASGKVPEKSNGLNNHMRRVKDEPFSAYQLVECWVRFWDAQSRGAARLAQDEGIETPVEGAPSAQFDAVMRQGGDAELYAAPYQWMAERAEGDVAFVAVTFPVIAHHAFGSLDPVGVFCKGFERARQSRIIADLVQSQRSGGPEWNWLGVWHSVFSESVLPVSMEHALPPFTSGMEVIERGPLRTHPIFREYTEMMDGLHSFLKNPLAQDLEESGLSGLGLSEQALAESMDMARQDPWMLFALPGLPAYRVLLGRHIPPPKVAFKNFSYSLRRPATIRHREVQAGASNVAETYADRSLDLDRRIRRFRAAEKAVALGLPPNAFETPAELTEEV